MWKHDTCIIGCLSFYGRCWKSHEACLIGDVYTLELPWKDNAKNISCIPAGQYEVSARPPSGRFGYPHLYVHRVEGRRGILFHVGNYAHETKGCILVGNGYVGKKITEEMEDTVMVTDSKRAMEEAMKHFGDLVAHSGRTRFPLFVDSDEVEPCYK